MTLADWHQRWMWLAITACGGAPGWTKAPASGTAVSVFDAPPLAGASYFAQVTAGDFGHPGAEVSLEHGSRKCGALVAALGEQRGTPADANAAASCDPATAQALNQIGGFLFLADARGQRWYSGAELVQAAGAIDSPAKAALAAWANGFELSWYDGKEQHGDLEHAIVRAVEGGFEVAAGAQQQTDSCGGEHPRQTVTHFRVTLFVDAHGAIHERERAKAYAYDIGDPCHPMGRRPADFADRDSGGTLRGHVERMLHHEAESVRAFERIARELAIHGAPGELVEAAARAARDERDHAARCARLAGSEVVIARDALPVRSLVDLAIDNAREGCVGEAYAALAAVVQARTAATPTLRAHFAAIAIDELAHAALASAIAAWLDRVLAPDERARVAAARATALAELAASTGTPSLPALGSPAGALAARLVASVASAGNS